MFLAIREIKHSALRHFLILAVISMVASLVFILSGLANGLASGNSEAIDSIDADSFVVGSGSEYLLDRSRLDNDVVEAVQSQSGVNDAQPFSASAGNVKTNDSDSVLGVSIIAVAPGSFLDPGAKSGSSLADDDSGVVIDQSLADEGVEVGDTLTFQPENVELKVVGITDGHQYRLAPTLFVPMEAYASIVPESDGIVNAIALQTDKDTFNKDEVPEGTVVGSRSDLVDNLPGYQEQRGTLLLIQVFLVVIAAGVIAAFFFILTLQKMSELGVMKAVGATTSTLARALVSQSMALTLIGIAIGVLAGIGMQYAAAGLVPFSLDAKQMGLYGLVLLVVAVGGTLISLVRIARVDPLDAINRPS